MAARLPNALTVHVGDRRHDELDVQTSYRTSAPESTSFRRRYLLETTEAY